MSKHWADRLVDAIRVSNRVIFVLGILFSAWWAFRAIGIVREHHTTGDAIDGHIILGFAVLGSLGLLWLATWEFFSHAERTGQEPAAQDSTLDGEYVEETFIVALTVSSTAGLTREELELRLHEMLPNSGERQDGALLEDWWVAEDDRQDRSDCDSAVFVPKGMQTHCRQVMVHQGYGQWSDNY